MSRVVRSTVRATGEDSIRRAYESHGAEAYYRKFGKSYRNPHEPIVRRSLHLAASRWSLDLARVLDLAAGNGEVTMALRELAAKDIDGIDPYSHEAYQARTGRPAERHTFEDIAAGALADRHYTLIVCAFALHLCEGSRLPGVAHSLSLLAPDLLILTPHKRPVLRPQWGWTLAAEMTVERVRTRRYRSVIQG